MEEQRKTSNTTITEDDINEVSYMYHLYSIFEVEKCVALKESSFFTFEEALQCSIRVSNIKKAMGRKHIRVVNNIKTYFLSN